MQYQVSIFSTMLTILVLTLLLNAKAMHSLIENIKSTEKILDAKIGREIAMPCRLKII